jgi:hypothetical protein
MIDRRAQLRESRPWFACTGPPPDPKNGSPLAGLVPISKGRNRIWRFVYESANPESSRDRRAGNLKIFGTALARPERAAPRRRRPP